MMGAPATLGTAAMEIAHDTASVAFACTGGADGATEWCFVPATVAECATGLAVLAAAGRRWRWLAAGSSAAAPALAGSAPVWTIALTRLRGCTERADSVGVFTAGAGTWAGAAEAALRRRQRTLGPWPPAMAATPLGDLYRRPQSDLPRECVEPWPVLAAAVAIGSEVARLERPGPSELRRADAVLELELRAPRLAPVERTATWRLQDAESTLLALQRLLPWVGPGCRVRAGPEVGLERGALWSRTSRAEAQWSEAVGRALPQAAAWLDRLVRQRGDNGWWLEVQSAAEAGLCELQLAEAEALLRDSGGRRVQPGEQARLQRFWPGDQALVAALAHQRDEVMHGANAHWEWGALRRLFASAEAARAWVQLDDIGPAGARLRAWTRKALPAPEPGPEVYLALGHLSGAAQASGQNHGDEPRPVWTAGPAPTLWVQPYATVADAARLAEEAGRALTLSGATGWHGLPGGPTWGDLLAGEARSRRWLRAAALPVSEQWWPGVVVAVGSAGEDGRARPPDARGPTALRLQVEALQAGSQTPGPLRLATESARQPLRLTRQAQWSLLAPRLVRLAPWLTGVRCAGVLCEGDRGRLYIEFAGHDARRRRAIDAIGAVLAGLETDAALEADGWPTAALLDCEVAEGDPLGGAPAQARALVELGARPTWLVARATQLP